ncbi:hypothetical protein [Streptomyces sp. NPDC002156]
MTWPDGESAGGAGGDGGVDQPRHLVRGQALDGGEQADAHRC